MSMRRLTFGRVQIYLEPRDAWVGVYVALDAVYVLLVPFLVFRWTRLHRPGMSPPAEAGHGGELQGNAPDLHRNIPSQEHREELSMTEQEQTPGRKTPPPEQIQKWQRGLRLHRHVRRAASAREAPAEQGADLSDLERGFGWSQDGPTVRPYAADGDQGERKD